MRYIVPCLCLCLAFPAAAQEPAIEVFGGTAFNFRTPLEVRRTHSSDIKLIARYETKPLEPPLYYSIRIGMRGRRHALEVQFTHHKLFLANTAGDLDHLEISHGYNILTINGALRLKHVDLRMGVGPVLAHVESVISAVAFGSPGYWHLTGPALLVGIGKSYSVTGRLFIAPEIQLIAARAHVPLGEVSFSQGSRGAINAPHVAVHVHVGFGILPLHRHPAD